MATDNFHFSLLNSENNDDIVECRVCDSVFAAVGDSVPRLLHCGHSVCHRCLTCIPLLHGDVLPCPFDRQPTQLPPSGVGGLKKNFALIELLEKLESLRRPIGGAACDDWDESVLERQKELATPCDENEMHTAVLYCVTCSTHLCATCARTTHATRTLSRHQHVPLSQKPRETPKCAYHPAHLVEFVCMEDGCQQAPLMCYICKDYGRHIKHQHGLLDTEAQAVRTSILSTLPHIRAFGDSILATKRKLGRVIEQIEGSPPGEAETDVAETQGSGEEACCHVRAYFSGLREALGRQEATALAVVDSHVRQRLATLKQQHRDTTLLLAQISAACHQCDRMLQEDDVKLWLAKSELRSWVESVQKQQQHFSELPDQLQLDPAVLITFTKDNCVHIGAKMEMRVVTLGLDYSGKTSILFQLKQSEFIQTIPTIGFNVETVEYKNLKFTFWDVGGQPKLRPLWKHYFFNTQALVFVVDASDESRVDEAYGELTKLLQEKELKGASLLILANKQDLQPCLSIEDLMEKFNLFKSCCNRSWHIQPCDARTGAGLSDGLEWLSHQLVSARV